MTQNIENLSYDDTNLRFDILFGIAYESDLNQAKTLAVNAAASISGPLMDPKVRPDTVLDELKGTGGKVLKTSLSHDDEAKLQEALSRAKSQ